MKLRFTLILLLTSIFWYPINAQDYRQYHTERIQADKDIFVNQNLQKGLSVYRTLFKKYDFVFLSDCITALQIALFANDEKAFLEITEKATKNGLLPRHLLKLNYVKQHPLYLKNKEQIIAFYRKNRQHYLARLDTAALKKMYRLYAFDQTQKNPRKGEDVIAYKRRYKRELGQTINEFRALVREKGFPGEKLIGVDQKDIMKELKTGAPDIADYYSLYKDIGRFSTEQIALDERAFSTTILGPIIVHYSFSYNAKAVHELLPDELYFREVTKGNIHPNYFAAFNDCAYMDALDDTKIPDLQKGDRDFGFESLHAGNNLIIPQNEVNKFRVKYYLSPLEVAKAKRKFMMEQGMHWRMGWEGILSE